MNKRKEKESGLVDVDGQKPGEVDFKRTINRDLVLLIAIKMIVIK